MRTYRQRQRGSSSIMAVLFVSMFSMLAVSFTSMSNMNVQTARNHRDLARAQAAAESGLAYADLLVAGYVPPAEAYSMTNTISTAEACQTFAFFAAYVQNALPGTSISWDPVANELRLPATGGVPVMPGAPGEFTLLFTFVPADADHADRLIVTSTGRSGSVTRAVQLTLAVKKSNKVLEYALASRGRVWVTGDSTIHGDVFSSWDRPEISPFNMTADSAVEGTINTVLSRAAIESNGYQLETLDEDGNPIFDEEGNRVHSPDDEVQGEHEGINYEQPFEDMPGMDISDYNTDQYKTDDLTTIPPCPSADREVEYFPHAAGNYNLPRDGTPGHTWNRRLDRHVYENQTFTDAYLPDNRNALFRNCTFEGILYIDCYKSGSSKYNNVRFENCTFNGPIITDVPQVFKWKHNVLYFTGSATFQNTAMAEATILAPHFNVNLGNTNPVEGESNVLTGAIVGGIVDVRGNAEIYGTIISMCDTTQWSSGYVTNIGATLNDGGSETSDPGDVGVIHITPDENQMLPSGMRTPIVIVVDGNSYVEL